MFCSDDEEGDAPADPEKKRKKENRKTEGESKRDKRSTRARVEVVRRRLMVI